MTITYPVSLPETGRIRNLTLVPFNKVAVSESSFTGEQQMQEHTGQWWRASVGLEPMSDADAAAWTAFIATLKGVSKTFLLGPPRRTTPLGSARARKNLLDCSEQFDNAVWIITGTGSVTPNTTTDPLGGITGDTITDSDAVAQRIIIDQVKTILDDYTSYAVSFYFFEGTAAITRIDVRLEGGTTVSNASNLTWSTHSVSTGSIEEIGSGWWRFTAPTIINNGTGNTVLRVRIFPASSTAATTGTVIAWGAQAEVGSAVTTYEHTTTGIRVRARQNLLKYAEVLSNGVWSTTGTPVITDDSVIAPDGTATGDTVNDNDGAGDENIYQDVTVADDSVTRTFSFYLKEGTAAVTAIALRYRGGGAIEKKANITWSGPSIDSNGILEAVGDGWYRASVTFANDSSGNTTARCRLNPAGTTAADTGTVFAWGAQLEEEVTAGPYVQTVASAETGEAYTAGGNLLYIDGLWPSTTGELKAGDYFQFGTGASSRLYMIEQAIDSDAWGNAIVAPLLTHGVEFGMPVWPGFRTAPADGDVLDLSSPVGVFRLEQNTGWSSSIGGFHAIGFSAREAL